MRIAIYSDVHGNLEALEAVLKDIKREEVDKRFFLGDVVGYGPNPNECIELVKKNADVILAGNHDWAAVGLTDSAYFNPYAKESLFWTMENITDANKEYLRTLKPASTVDNIQLCHSTPVEPQEWRYILTMQDAMDNYDGLEKPVCFIGHSHQPVIIEFADGSNIVPIRDIYKTLEPNRKYIVNVGSVGQSRDSNPESCYVVYDTKTNNIEYRRVEYDVAKVQKKMEKHKLPHYLIERLGVGR
ncbi:MAG: metallophosphoesterase family protein [Nitrospinae bacterium]|nr:metallophosphoesterase family protein [Nitrospinota bacterium]